MNYFWKQYIIKLTPHFNILTRLKFTSNNFEHFQQPVILSPTFVTAHHCLLPTQCWFPDEMQRYYFSLCHIRSDLSSLPCSSCTCYLTTCSTGIWRANIPHSSCNTSLVSLKNFWITSSISVSKRPQILRFSTSKKEKVNYNSNWVMVNDWKHARIIK